MRMIRTKLAISVTALVTAGFVSMLPAVAQALTTPQTTPTPAPKISGPPNPTASSAPKPSSGIGSVPDYDQSLGNFNSPLEIKTVPALLARAVRILLALVGMVSVAVIILSGFRLVAQGDNAQQVTKARKAITWAILGLLTSLLSFSIVSIIQRIIQR